MSRVVILLFASVLISIVQGAFAHGQERQPALDAITARQETLRTIEVVYQVDETFSPVVPAVKESESDTNDELAGYSIVMVTGSRSWECRFRHARGKAYYERLVAENSPSVGGPPEPTPQIKSYSGSRFETRIGSTGIIRNNEPLPSDTVIDVALGLRLKDAEKWPSPDAWNDFTLQHNDDGTATLKWRPLDPKYQGRRMDVWTFDAELGYALVRYEVLWKPEGSDEFATDTEIENSDFRPVSGVMLPYNVRYRMFYNQVGAEPHLTMTVQLRIKSYKLGELKGTDEEFLITWPEGSVVLDSRNDRQIVVRGGPQQLTDERLKNDYAKGSFRLEEDGFEAGTARFWLITVNLILVFAILGFVVYRRYWRRAN